MHTTFGFKIKTCIPEFKLAVTKSSDYGEHTHARTHARTNTARGGLVVATPGGSFMGRPSKVSNQPTHSDFWSSGEAALNVVFRPKTGPRETSALQPENVSEKYPSETENQRFDTPSII